MRRLALTVLLLLATTLARQQNRLLLILVDGVRWDYMNDAALKGFPRMAKHGVRAEYVTPIYPSNSYPNWYSIVTGLYAENHGFVQNYMYDQKRGDTFLMTPHPNATHEHWWNQSEPIWISAEKHGIRTAMYWWDGCQVPIGGVKVTRCHEYINYWVWGSVNEDTANALDEVMDWFQESDDNRLALLYYEGVDATGHFRGPDSEDTRNVLREFDKILEKFQEKLEKTKLDKQVNVMVVSDHGMSQSSPAKVKVIDLERYNVTDDIQLMLDRGSLSMILPVEGREDQLYNNLKNANIKGLTVYRKNEIPEKYHLRKNDLVLPLLLTADEGFFIQRLPDPQKMKPSYSRIFKGYHGYDPYKTDNMRTIFYARGPDILEKHVTGPLLMVDYYNLLCNLLGIAGHPNNGSWERISGVLRPTKELFNSHSHLHQELPSASSALNIRHTFFSIFLIATIFAYFIHNFS